MNVVRLIEIACLQGKSCLLFLRKNMINGRIPELTIKFTERPQNIPTEGKKATIEIKGENDIAVKAEVNRKSLKKVVTKMDTWENWVAALSGKMQSISAEGVVELVDAGINIFEIKQKEPKPAPESTAA